MDGDSESGRILENLALSLNQHSKLTALSLGFINMERHKSMPTHTHTHKLSKLSGICKQGNWHLPKCAREQVSRCIIYISRCLEAHAHMCNYDGHETELWAKTHRCACRSLH